jgi:hypothetical protein
MVSLKLKCPFRRRHRPVDIIRGGAPAGDRHPHATPAFPGRAGEERLARLSRQMMEARAVLSLTHHGSARFYHEGTKDTKDNECASMQGN